MSTLNCSHLIIPINSFCYDPALLSIFASTIPRYIPFSYSLMGSTTKKIISLLLEPDKICTITDITAPCFNYAYCMNRAIKYLMIKKLLLPEHLLILSDSWTPISYLQIFSQVDPIDFKKDFCVIESFQDITPEPLNYNKKNIMLSIANRTKKLKQFKKEILQKNIPIAIVSVKQFIEAGGLEETMFTDYSRLYMIEMLHKNGYNKIAISNYESLRLSNGPIYPIESMENDIKIYEQLRHTSGHKLNLPANLGKEWGDPEQIKFLQNSRGVGMWNIKKLTNSLIPDISNESKAVEKTEVELVDGSEIVQEDDILPMRNEIRPVGYKVHTSTTLVAVKNTPKDIMLCSNIIKDLFTYYGPITILTDRKLFPAINLIKQSPIIKEVYDINQHLNNPIDVNKFTRIFKISGFTSSIDLGPNCKTVNSIIKHAPYCLCTPSKMNADNYIGFGFSVTPKGYHDEKNKMVWIELSELLNQSLNLTKTFILSIENERIIANNISNKKETFTQIYLNRSLMFAADLIKTCNVFVCHESSDMFWIAYGLKQRTVVICEDGKKIPDAPWIFKTPAYNDRRVEDTMQQIIANF